MQFKLLAALLFSATALAAPQATGTSSDSMDAAALLASVPNSILTVIETAVPVSFLNDIMDPSSRSSLIAQIEAGTLPAWYSSLPNSVKAWATSAFFNAEASATDAAASGATATGSGSTASGSAPSASAAVSSAVPSASAAASSNSASASSAAASATSSGGAAPVATGGVAMSMVGAAGILGLALAL
ncbi:uncharacterized protein N7458_007693 [Penicillium daleae]|uniref:Uncharacterized protein n=1 Tax=Penicillium daleae TaxID=63821 RepID=A0AAD6C1J4_9EURO|nr:uncharacterized protein N7458_007693 [Penicillium daleae]KAJ5443821.1 hypothetical protein N7458_007693 [Penicillium daleae]